MLSQEQRPRRWFLFPADLFQPMHDYRLQVRPREDLVLDIAPGANKRASFAKFLNFHIDSRHCSLCVTSSLRVQVEWTAEPACPYFYLPASSRQLFMYHMTVENHQRRQRHLLPSIPPWEPLCWLGGTVWRWESNGVQDTVPLDDHYLAQFNTSVCDLKNYLTFPCRVEQGDCRFWAVTNDRPMAPLGLGDLSGNALKLSLTPAFWTLASGDTWCVVPNPIW